jgi:hypothetical protein
VRRSVGVAQDENSHSTTGEGHLRESSLTSFGVAIATSILTGDEDVQTPTTSGVFRRPWQMTLPSEPHTESTMLVFLHRSKCINPRHV